MTSQTTTLRRSSSPVLARPLAAFMATVAALALAVLSGCGSSSSPGPTAAPPVVTSVAPAQVTTAGGPVLVNGTGFSVGAQLFLGGVSVASTRGSDAQLSASAPAHAAGAVDVRVVNADGQASTLAGGLTYVNPPPTVTGVTPPSGTSRGGQQVTVGGANFLAGATVTFDGVPATAVTVTGPTQITCTTPAHAAAVVAVAVTNTDAQTASQAAAYTFVAPPVVTSVQPGQVATTGEPVLVLGSGFSANAQVFFGGVSSPATRLSEAQLAVAAPPHAAGAVDVRVVNADGQQSVLPGALTYSDVPPPPPPNVPPVPTGLDAVVGPEAGGTVVVISGTKFDSHIIVTFGGQLATVSGVTGTQLTAVTPPHAAGVVDVVLTNPPNGATVNAATLPAAFTYQPPPPPPAPTVTSVTPPTGTTAGGQRVTVDGTNFVAGATVTFGGSDAPVVSTSATAIVVTTPAHAAGPVAVVVRNPDAQTGSKAAAFTFVAPPAPTVASVTPSTGTDAGGQQVTVNGANFVAGATVTFGGNAATAVVVVSPTQLTCTTPAHAPGAVAVAVTNPDTQTGSQAAAFTYQAPPLALTTVSPATGPASGGITVTLTGSSFAAGATVTFGGNAATTVVVVSSTQITCTAPAHAAGAVDVVVTVPGAGSATKAAGFTYQPAGQPAPTITSISPASGPIGTTNVVTITGTNLVTGVAVTFGGIPVTGTGPVSVTGVDVSVVGTVPGTVDVVVRNPDGQTATKAAAYTFLGPAPVITALNRRGAPPNGGLPMLIVGTGFTAASTVSFGGVLATSISYDPVLKALSFTIPPHAEGFVDIVVQNPDGQSDTFAGFHYGPTPVVTGIAPTTGKRDDIVVITGTFFDPTATVQFTGNTSVVSARDPVAGTISVIVPKLNPGPYFLVVTNADGQFGVSPVAFTNQ